MEEEEEGAEEEEEVEVEAEGEVVEEVGDSSGWAPDRTMRRPGEC